MRQRVAKESDETRFSGYNRVRNKSNSTCISGTILEYGNSTKLERNLINVLYLIRSTLKYFLANLYILLSLILIASNFSYNYPNIKLKRIMSLYYRIFSLCEYLN